MSDRVLNMPFLTAPVNKFLFTVNTIDTRSTSMGDFSGDFPVDFKQVLNHLPPFTKENEQ